MTETPAVTPAAPSSAPALGPALQPALTPGGPPTVAKILALQRAAGNVAVSRWLIARDDYAYDAAAASKQVDDTTMGLTGSQQGMVQHGLLPYPQAIRAQLPPAAPNFATAKSLMLNFESTLRGLGASHGSITSRARALLESAHAPMGEVNAMLDMKTMSAKDRAAAVEGRLRNAESELKQAERYTQAEFDAQVAKAKSAGATARDEATEENLRRRYAPLTDDQRAELRARFLEPLAGFVAEVIKPAPDYDKLRDPISALATNLQAFGAGASEKVAPDLQSAQQKLSEASRMIDAITGDQTATVTTLRQLLGEIESILHRLLALPRRYDPEDPEGSAARPTHLPPGFKPPDAVTITPE